MKRNKKQPTRHRYYIHK